MKKRIYIEPECTIALVFFTGRGKFLSENVFFDFEIQKKSMRQSSSVEYFHAGTKQ